MIIAILVLAFILRLVNLNQSLWLDEAVQAITAKSSFAYIFQEITGDFHPPLYHFLMHFWVRAFGNSEISLRSPSVLFGTATVWIVYKIMKLLAGKEMIALAASILMATAPFHIYYSQEARMYALSVFLTAISFYFFLSLLKKDKGLLLFLVSTILALFTDYYFFLILSIYWLVFIIARKYKWFVYSFVPLLIFAIWLPMFLTQIKTGMRAAQLLPEWGRMVNLSTYKAIPLTFIKFSIGRITIFNKTAYGIVSLAILFFYGFIFFSGLTKLKKDNRKWGIVVVWFAFPLIASWLGSFVVPNFQPFRLLLILPAFYLLLTYSVFSFDTMIRIIVSAFVVGINLISMGVYFGNKYFWREDWRGVVRYVEARETATAIIPSETSSWPWQYYAADQSKLVYLTSGVETAEPLVVKKRVGEIKSKQVFYIRYLVPLFDPNELINGGLTTAGYSKIRETSFNQIPVWEYIKE